MSGTQPGAGPDDAVTGSWACEALPMSVRRQLLERELRRLGLPRVDGHRAGPEAPAPDGKPPADRGATGD